MTRCLALLAVGVAFFLALAQPSALTSQESKPENGKTKKPMLLVLEGTAYERGAVHGKALKEPIRKLIELWKAEVKRVFEAEPDPLIKEFVKKTNYLPAIKKWTPELIDEVKGLAAGSGIDYDAMFAFQLLDEFWVQAESIASEHCSSMGFAKRGKQPAIVAQNLDLDTYFDGYQVVLHIKHGKSGLESFVVTSAGCIGSNGVNNRSIGVCCNTLADLNSRRDGLPVAFVIRGILEQTKEEDAVAFIRGVKHATGQNYVIGGPDNVYCFECSANKVARYRPDGQDAAVWHSNHALVNRDLVNVHRSRQERKEERDGLKNSKARLECLERRLAKENGSRLEQIKSALASHDSDEHPVCGAGGKEEYYTRQGLFTFAATIMVLGEAPHLFVAPGPPDRTPYGKYTFAQH